MSRSHLKLVTPATIKRTVTPRRLPNAELRTREYLTEAEIERLVNAAKRNRSGNRDATMILVAGHPSWLTCAGSKSSSAQERCTCVV